MAEPVKLKRGVMLAALLLAAGLGALAACAKDAGSGSSGGGDQDGGNGPTGPAGPPVVTRIEIDIAATAIDSATTIPLIVDVSTASGAAAPDGTPVELTTSALGKLLPASTATTGGRAVSTFNAGYAAGPTTITATSGDVSASVDMEIRGGGVRVRRQCEAVTVCAGGKVMEACMSMDSAACWYQIGDVAYGCASCGDRTACTRDAYAACGF